MTRIAPFPTPAQDAERTTDRAPAGSRGAPFRAALRAAGKEKAAANPAGNDAMYTISSQSPMAAAMALGGTRDGAQSAEPEAHGVASGSIAVIAAPSLDEPIGLPVESRIGAPLGKSGRAASDRAADAPGEILLDTMLANAGIATAVAAAPQPPPPAIVLDDSPVATCVAASVARAIGSPGSLGALGGAAGGSPPSPVGGAGAGGDVPIAPALGAIAVHGAMGAPAVSAATPLEQAVHDLIVRFIDRAGERAGERDDELAPDAADGQDAGVPLPAFAAPTAPAPAAHDGRGSATAPGHAAREADQPEPPANPSHVHLVLDDGPERTVVTVAVRGSEVHVALRSHDDATAAALARNAASLDHAMRARGLELGELTAERDPSGQRPPRDPEPRERPARNAERFTLEETP
jgi:hypothetical protein